MESIGPSGNTTKAFKHRWAAVMGTVIALLTLILPLWVIAYYSSPNSNLPALPQTTYSLPNSGN